VIDAEQVQQGCVEIVHVDGLFDDVVAEIVGGAEERARASRRRRPS